MGKKGKAKKKLGHLGKIIRKELSSMKRNMQKGWG
jgi:hypothetical protein